MDVNGRNARDVMVLADPKGNPLTADYDLLGFGRRTDLGSPRFDPDKGYIAGWEEEMLDAIKFAHEAIKPMCQAQLDLGQAALEVDAQRNEGLAPLLDAIVATIPAPSGDPTAPLQALVTNLDASDYLGRLAIGRVVSGTLRQGQPVIVPHAPTSGWVRLSEVEEDDTTKFIGVGEILDDGRVAPRRLVVEHGKKLVG